MVSVYQNQKKKKETETLTSFEQPKVHPITKARLTLNTNEAFRIAYRV